VLNSETFSSVFTSFSSFIYVGSIFYTVGVTGVFPFADVGVVPGLTLSLVVVLPDGGFLVPGGFLLVPGKGFDAELGSCLDDVAVVPVAGLAEVGVVVVFAGGLVGSALEIVAVVAVLIGGGFEAVFVGFVGVTVFFGSIFYGAFLTGSGFGGFVVLTGFFSVVETLDSFLFILLCVNSTF
jgi:hypothetical protein